MGELSRGLGKVKSRFIEEMIYGLQARGSSRLTEISHALDETINLHKTRDRLCRNLDDSRMRRVIGSYILEDGFRRIMGNTLLIVDTSDITKKYARKMEYLCEVRDGSEGEIGKGYWMARLWV